MGKIISMTIRERIKVYRNELNLSPNSRRMFVEAMQQRAIKSMHNMLYVKAKNLITTFYSVPQGEQRNNQQQK